MAHILSCIWCFGSSAGPYRSCSAKSNISYFPAAIALEPSNPLWSVLYLGCSPQFWKPTLVKTLDCLGSRISPKASTSTASTMLPSRFDWTNELRCRCRCRCCCRSSGPSASVTYPVASSARLVVVGAAPLAPASPAALGAPEPVTAPASLGPAATEPAIRPLSTSISVGCCWDWWCWFWSLLILV